MELKIGATGCYINDYDFAHLVDIPVEAAVAWVKKVAPETKMCCTGRTRAKDLTIGGDIDTDANVNGWLNKLFIIVACEYVGSSVWIALYNHDGVFSIRYKKV